MDARDALHRSNGRKNATPKRALPEPYQSPRHYERDGDLGMRLALSRSSKHAIRRGVGPLLRAERRALRRRLA